MSSYLVFWVIDAMDKDSPREAAEWARSRQRDPDSWVGCFTVRDMKTGDEVDVDLDAPEVEEIDAGLEDDLRIIRKANTN